MLKETIVTEGGMILTVDKLSDDRVLIILGIKEMEDFALDFEKLSLNDLHSRKILLRIMQIACRKTGIETRGKSVSIEALSFDEDCYILVTVTQKSRRTYRVKKNDESVCYLLGESANFLETVEKLYRQNVYCNRNSAYFYDSRYYLIFDYPTIPKKLRRVLSEYGEKSGGKLAAAKVRENGKLLCRHNAIMQIGRYLV